MPRLRAPFTYPVQTIDPDRKVTTTPYLAFRSGDRNSVWFALAFRCIKWNLNLSGTIAGTFPAGSYADGSTFDGSWNYDFSISSDASIGTPFEKQYAKIIPPIPSVVQPNSVMTGSNNLAAATVIGTVAVAYVYHYFNDDGPQTEIVNAVTELILLVPGGPGSGDGVCYWNQDFGGSSGAFGCNFEFIGNIAQGALISGGIATDGSTQIGPIPTIEYFGTSVWNNTSTAGNSEIGEFSVQVPIWDAPGTTDSVSFPIYWRQSGDIQLATTLTADALMTPEGGALGNGSNASGYVWSYQTAGSETDPNTDGSRIWNNDLTAHRMPFYPYSAL